MGLSRINRSHLLLVCFLLAACQSAKYLPEGEKLYVGATVKLVSSKHIKNERHMKAILKNAIRPQPNKSFLGIRPKLWMFWMSKNNSVKILNKWFNKNGEVPVLMSNTNKKKTS